MRGKNMSEIYDDEVMMAQSDPLLRAILRRSRAVIREFIFIILLVPQIRFSKSVRDKDILRYCQNYRKACFRFLCGMLNDSFSLVSRNSECLIYRLIHERMYVYHTLALSTLAEDTR